MQLLPCGLYFSFGEAKCVRNLLRLRRAAMAGVTRRDLRKRIKPW